MAGINRGQQDSALREVAAAQAILEDIHIREIHATKTQRSNASSERLENSFRMKISTAKRVHNRNLRAMSLSKMASNNGWISRRFG